MKRTFGDNLKEQQERAKKRTGDLANEIGVVNSAVSGWRHNKAALPEMGTFLKLAKALKCSVDDLLRGIDPEYDQVLADRDLIRQTADQQSPLTSVVERGSDVPASGAVGSDLIERVQRLETELANTREVANRLAGLLEQSGVSAKTRPAEKPATGARRGHRKTG